MDLEANIFLCTDFMKTDKQTECDEIHINTGGWDADVVSRTSLLMSAASCFPALHSPASFMMQDCSNQFSQRDRTQTRKNHCTAFVQMLMSTIIISLNMCLHQGLDRNCISINIYSAELTIKLTLR